MSHEIGLGLGRFGWRGAARLRMVMDIIYGYFWVTTILLLWDVDKLAVDLILESLGIIILITIDTYLHN